MLSFEHWPRPLIACNQSPRNAFTGRDPLDTRTRPAILCGRENGFVVAWLRLASSREASPRQARFVLFFFVLAVTGISQALTTP
ncbi:unnamed protein product [Brassica oleracea var. botrytis]|uniref:(rape) hypothetical protein n=1 Tax=Brassica napus TaxID=3708 RepID=A0A816J053_BRANA|nr:unnamed protein product [Brassica napus]